MLDLIKLPTLFVSDANAKIFRCDVIRDFNAFE